MVGKVLLALTWSRLQPWHERCAELSRGSAPLFIYLFPWCPFRLGWSFLVDSKPRRRATPCVGITCKFGDVKSGAWCGVREVWNCDGLEERLTVTKSTNVGCNELIWFENMIHDVRVSLTLSWWCTRRIELKTCIDFCHEGLHGCQPTWFEMGKLLKSPLKYWVWCSHSYMCPCHCATQQFSSHGVCFFQWRRNSVSWPIPWCM